MSEPTVPDALLPNSTPATPCNVGSPVQFTFRADMPNAHAPDLIPIGVRAVDTEQCLGRIAPEQMAGASAEEAAVEARAGGVELDTELATERNR